MGKDSLIKPISMKRSVEAVKVLMNNEEVERLSRRLRCVTYGKVIGAGETHGSKVIRSVATPWSYHVRVGENATVTPRERTHYLCHARHGSLQLSWRFVEGEGSTDSLAESKTKTSI